jgi:predicted TIM-barrel fold metal-dependent hydrolase
MLIIDAHTHVYSPDETTYPPVEKPLRPPQGCGTLDHLRREAAACGVRQVCVVQTSSFYQFDNQFILDLSAANRDWIAGICTLDPDDENSPELLKLCVQRYGVRGMRSIPAAEGTLDHEGVRRLWRTACDLGIVINLPIDPLFAGEADVLLEAYPDLRVVLDHCLNLKAGPNLAPTLQELKRLARRSSLHAKLSFVSSGSSEEYPFRDMHEPCLEVLHAFGADRCAWGSDFPCELWTPKANYRGNLDLFLHEMPMSTAEREAVLGNTARGLWFPEIES